MYNNININQPIITGMAYNPTKKHAYDVPANKTKSYWKDRTHKGEGFNEIRFESENGQEEIRTIAQRDMNTVVRQDHSKVVDGQSVSTVKGNRLIETVGNTTQTSMGGINIVSGPTAIAMTMLGGFGNLANKVSKSASLLKMAYLSRIRPGDINMVGDLNIVQSAGYDHISFGGQNLISTAGSDSIANAGRNMKISVGKSKREHIAENHRTTVGGMSLHRTETFYDLAVGQKVTIRSGKSRIEMDAEGNITISGANINMKADGEIALNAGKIKLNS